MIGTVGPAYAVALMKPEEGRSGDFCWTALVARVLHSVDVQIIEAFQQIEKPLSAGDLSQLFDRKTCWSSLVHHTRRLTELGASLPKPRRLETSRHPLSPREAGEMSVERTSLQGESSRGLTGEDAILPKYNPERVERAVLEEAIEMHPVHLAIPDLILRISADSEDGKEVETITCAIDNLKRSGLIQNCNEDRAGPT